MQGRQIATETGQIRTSRTPFEKWGKGYDLGNELCPYLSILCLSPQSEIKEKTLQIIEFEGFVYLLFGFVRYICGSEGSISYKIIEY
ncbi:hypothetical protein EZS27_041799 [termite gut metagenome]|uniref:Uncharacterized protein n=1 Tax=termite gut metagenome TaxID=433724 RepID=A0A5J4PCY6_9ZZZZ